VGLFHSLRFTLNNEFGDHPRQAAAAREKQSARLQQLLPSHLRFALEKHA
jgi:hypothetical protein